MVVAEDVEFYFGGAQFPGLVFDQVQDAACVASAAEPFVDEDVVDPERPAGAGITRRDPEHADVGGHRLVPDQVEVVATRCGAVGKQPV